MIASVQICAETVRSRLCTCNLQEVIEPRPGSHQTSHTWRAGRGPHRAARAECTKHAPSACDSIRQHTHVPPMKPVCYNMDDRGKRTFVSHGHVHDCGLKRLFSCARSSIDQDHPHTYLVNACYVLRTASVLCFASESHDRAEGNWVLQGQQSHQAG